MTTPTGGTPGYPGAEQPGYGQAPPPPAAPLPPGYGQAPPPPGYGQQPYQPGYPGAPVPPPSMYRTPQTGVGVPATMGARLLARIIDGVVIGIPSMILMFAFGVSLFSGTTCHTDSDGFTTCDASAGKVGAFFAVYGIVFLLALLYEFYFIGTKGATLGKMALGIKVVDAGTGGTIGMGRAFVRYLVLGVTGSICTLGYWSPFFDSSRRYQGWHDKAGNDFVISTK